MIVLPAALFLGLLGLLLTVALVNTKREATNLMHVAEDDYQRQGTNWGVLLLTLLLLLVLAGAVGLGPLAGLIVAEGMR